MRIISAVREPHQLCIISHIVLELEYRNISYGMSANKKTRLQITIKEITFKELLASKLKTSYLVVSDVHVGAEFSITDFFMPIIYAIHSKWVIFNGDTYQEEREDDMHITDKDRKNLAAIKALAKTRKIVFTKGNHDEFVDTSLLQLVGARKFDNFIDITVSGVKVRITHGHLADDTYPKEGSWTMFVAKYTDRVARIIGQKDLYDKLGNLLYGVKRKVLKASIQEAKAIGAQIIINGHTHFPEVLQKEGVTVINTGSISNRNPAFVTIDEKGIVLYKVTSLIA